MTGNTGMHLLVTDTLKKELGAWIRKTSQYLVWLPFASCSTTHLLRKELIRLFILDCEMLSHSSMTAKLLDIGTHCHTCRSRASQTCSMGDMSGVYAGPGRTGKCSASRNCVQILATWGHALSCWNIWWWWRMNGMTMGLRILSRYLCASKLLMKKCNRVHCM